jgi:hypothetical protein
MPEKIIYDDGLVKITTSRVVIGGSTYQLRNISSIRVVEKIRNWVGWIAFFGVLCLTTIFTSPKDAIYCVPLGIAILFIAFKIGFYDFFIYFDTNAGSVSAYMGKKEKCFQIKDMIEEAMAEA